MEQHYLLWASGEDRPGIVASVTKALFDNGMNLEDSSMMRLGSEFGIFLIFSSSVPTSIERLEKNIHPITRRLGLAAGIKKISRKQAQFRKSSGKLFLVTVYGPDQPGIVYHVTSALTRRKFNVTDLSTHRTVGGKRAGYILFIEGELPSSRALAAVRADLKRLQRDMKTKVDIRPIQNSAL